MWQVRKNGPWEEWVTEVVEEREYSVKVTVFEYYTIYNPTTRAYIYTSDGKEIKRYDSLSEALHKCAELIHEGTAGGQYAAE